MSYRSVARASAHRSRDDASTLAQKVTCDTSPAVVLQFATLEELDERFSDFLHHAEVAWKHSDASLRGYKGTYGNFRTYLASDPRPLPEKLCDIDGWVAWNERRAGARGAAIGHDSDGVHREPLSGVTINTYFRQLRPFFYDLEERDGLPNPFCYVRPPKVPAKLSSARTPEECDHILRTAEHMVWQSPLERRRAVAIIATFLYAGLRKGELLRLGFGDVHFGRKEILVNAQKTNDQRIVPMNADLYEALQRYKKEREAVFGGDAGAGFFTSLATAQGISESTLRRTISRIRRVSGVPFSMHSLRHSFVTRWLNEDGQIHVVQLAAGHKKITTTAGYVRVRQEDLHREIQKLSYRTRAIRRR